MWRPTADPRYHPMIPSPCRPIGRHFRKSPTPGASSRTDRAAVVVHGRCGAVSPTAQHPGSIYLGLGSYGADTLVGDGSAGVRQRCK